jgi:membrane-bound ClpP family serine protease
MIALAEAAQAAPAAMSPTAAIGWASLLLVLAGVLAVVEFLVVSWGMLIIGAVISAVAAVALSFQAGPAAGWTFLVLTPGVGIAAVAIGLRLMRRTKAAVMSTEITADAGLHHVADSHGVGPNALGELMTKAYPTGRARFNGRHGPVELDVVVQGAVLDQGARVVVLAISGPTITVGPAPDTVSGLMTNTPT